MTDWPRSPETGEVHLWFCHGVTDPRGDDLLLHLGPEERTRAEAFRFEVDRRRFTGARLLLRAVLAHYLDCAPAGLRFTTGAWGKPLLASAGHPALAFNLSRSHEVALLAVGGGDEVGVDVEYLNPARADARLVERHFSDPERAYIKESGDPKVAFYEIWTRKEAYLKAIGRGLSHPLCDFNVAPENTRADKRSAVRDWSAVGGTAVWVVRNVALPAPGYAAALATADSAPEVSLFQLPAADLLARLSP